MRISLQTIATHLGLSRSTISLALKKDPRIPLRTRARVKAACKEMGYQPHALISELASSRWQAKKGMGGNVIAYLDCSPDPGVIGINRAPALARQAADLGYQLQTFRAVDYTAPRLSKILHNRGITDVIIGSVIDKSHLLELDWAKLICVQFLPGSYPLPFHGVVRDNFQAVVLAWRKAVSFGYTRIGITLLEHPFPVVDDIMRASAAYACQHLYFPHLPKIPIYYQKSPDRNAFLHWARRNRPDVIIGFSEAYYHFYRSEFGRPSPYITLHIDPASTMSGIPGNDEDCAREVVSLLHFCRRTYQWGIPKYRVDHVVEPTWFEGDTLPFKDARVVHR